MPTNPIKYCRKCGVDKPLSAFGVVRSNSDGLNRYCKSCIVKYAEQRNPVAVADGLIDSKTVAVLKSVIDDAVFRHAKQIKKLESVKRTLEAQERLNELGGDK